MSDEVLTANDLFSTHKPKVHKVEIEELGRTVCLLELSGEAMDAYQAVIMKGFKPGSGSLPNMTNVAAVLVTHSLCAEDGKREFKNSDLQKVNSQINATVLKALSQKIQEINKIGGKAVELEGKDLGKTLMSVLGSGSQESSEPQSTSSNEQCPTGSSSDSSPTKA